ncbi:hypothetical protein LXL04_027652 [Taraxacum kok-saghyz]
MLLLSLRGGFEPGSLSVMAYCHIGCHCPLHQTAENANFSFQKEKYFNKNLGGGVEIAKVVSGILGLRRRIASSRGGGRGRLVPFQRSGLGRSKEKKISTSTFSLFLSHRLLSSLRMEGGGEELIMPIHDPDVSPVGSLEETIMDPHSENQPQESDDHPHPPPSATDTATLTDELRDKIIRQVEYYFSDENLRTDKFLLKYLAKEDEGYVPVAVIASFKKMKKLTHHKSLIVAALKESSLLTLSSNEKKVKRVHPFPLTEAFDPELCTVLVENLPEDHTIENMKKMFGQAGLCLITTNVLFSIKKITIHEENAAREQRKCSIEEKLLSGKLHAVVEYDTVEAAENAVATLNNEQDWRHGMRVKLLKRKAKIAPRKKIHESEKKFNVQVDPPIEKENQHSSEHHDDTPNEENMEKNGNRGCQNRRRSRKNKYQSPSGIGMGHGTLVHNNSHGGEVTGSKPPPGPRMPDGTRGFTMGRGRPPVI